MGLDTKYRPSIFDDVLGQEVPVTILKSIVEKKQYSSAYFFSGPPGIGKTTLGRIFSKAILCSDPVKGNPCNICESCQLFSQEKHFGYRELDAATYGGKDDMIKLRDDAAFLSVENKKIILLDECHDISRQGQDALLKQVEQCPEHLVYVFCTTEPEKIRPTLRKRCVQFRFSTIEPSLILKRLKQVCQSESITYEEQALQIIADRSGGLVRDALKTLEEASYFGSITPESVLKVSTDYSNEIFDVLANLGIDLPKVLTLCKKIVAIIPVKEFYEQLVSMVCDAVKILYGYEDFIPSRKTLLLKLRDLHGSNLIEFMGYLLARDKFIDRVGLQGDIILLHYRFCSNGFKPQVPVDLSVKKIAETPPAVPEPVIPEPVQSDSTSSPCDYAQLSKMGLAERTRVLRRLNNGQSVVFEKEVQPKVPADWPLPKKEDSRESFTNVEEELSPLDCSHLLVGGRGGKSV